MDPRGDADSDEPVEAYLDELFDRLAGTGRAGRQVMAEAEDHLLSLPPPRNPKRAKDFRSRSC